MFFSRKYSKLDNFQKIVIGAVFSLFFSLVSFASQSYATDTFYNYGTITIQASICKQTTISGRSYPYMNCSQEVGVTVSSSPDGDPTAPRQTFLFKGNTSQDLTTAYTSTIGCTASNVKCFLRISRILFSPKSDSNNYVYLQDGDFYLYRLTSTNDIFLGTAREFYSSTVEDQFYTFGGLDSYLNFNMQGQYSCLDLANNPCAVSYRFNHDRDDLELDGNFSSIVTSGKVSDTTAYNYEFINNVYNSTLESYDRSAYDGLLYYIPLTNKNTFNANYTLFEGYIFFYQTDDFVDISSSGVNPDDNPELGVIQDATNDANSSNAQLGGISIPIFNPISSWLVLFTDSQCIDISVVPGWFGLSSQHICSPWYASIRDVLTPIISIGGTLLLFGFAIRWLNGSSYYKGDISG